MSTSLLFHAFGIRGYQLQKTEFSEGNVYFHITQDRNNLRCPVCKSSKVICRGKKIRTFKSVPIGHHKTFIVLPVQRVFCDECTSIGSVQIQFAEQKKRFTRAFKQYALSLLRYCTIKDVAVHLGVGWDLIKEIDKSDVKKFENPPLKDLKQIAIDEISFGKGHNYITVVLNIESGAIVFIGDGKGSDSLDPFWQKLKRAKAKVEAVATDLSPAYISAVKNNLPDALHVADPFHVVKLFNDKLSDLRRDIYNQADHELKKRS